MKFIFFIWIASFPTLIHAQCNGVPKTYNYISLQSSFTKLENLNYYGPEIEYIGYPKDSIYIGVGSKIEEDLDKHKITKEIKEKNTIIEYYNSKFAIQVCNQFSIKKRIEFSNSKSIENQILNCYSVIIKNIDSLPIEISIGKLIPISLEVKENDSTWKTVIEEQHYECATGYPHYYLNPTEIIIVTIPILNLNKKNLRFKKGNTYSNAFYQDIKMKP